MCGFAYTVSMIVYQVGGLISGEAPFGVFTVLAFALLAGLVYMLVRRGYQGEAGSRSLSSVAAAAR